MKRFWLIAIIMTCSLQGRADLLDRMHLEDSLRSRIEDVMKIYDPKAKVLLRFDLKKFGDVLPGTSLSQADADMSPMELGSKDISRVAIEIYTSVDPVPPEARDLILKVLPIEHSKISIEYKKNHTIEERSIPNPLDEKGLERIAGEVVTQMSKVILGVFATGLFVFIGFVLFIGSKRNKEMQKHLDKLSAAIGDIAGNQAVDSSREVRALNPPTTTTTGQSQKGPNQLDEVTTSSLEELFADCYWCKKDAYAHWLWQNLSSRRRKELLSEIPFLKEYCSFFVDLSPQEESYHSHPYYLDPFPLSPYSQEDLSQVVGKNLSLWHQLSPLRQSSLGLTLEARLKAVETPPKENGRIALPASSKRLLERKSNWSDLNVADELVLFENPDMVPEHLRSNIKTLVWFAKKPKGFVEDTLSRYDARTLAEIWVGPDALLKVLETHLPEKKLKLLSNYRQKVHPTRHHPVFNSLMQEGLKHDVA